ncbi:Ubiquitin-conjugating enzyme E2 27 [Triticum urartu]|uniref:Ubiquitin-conjugating enzyme E2 27 n=1 Tax=Triticum urartu TaxID=4572 RepID=M8ABJ7_TRIUA|nr:Ubiquitin-conjugating enzyme E2 27 [Triticum urartu]
MVDVSRVQKELTECNRDSDISGVSIALHDGGSSITHLTGTIAGPRDSPYEGGTFRIDIRLPGGYPFEPPKMQFITKRGVGSTAAASRGVVQMRESSGSRQHRQARCGRVAAAGSTVRLDAGDQLSLPPCCPDSRRDFVGAEEDEFADAYWSFFAVLLMLHQHAAMTTPSSPPVQKLVEMGFPEDMVRSALMSVNGDENMALEKLCSG